MALILQDDQKVELSIAPVTAEENPAQVESVTWVSSDTNILTLTASADGMKAEAVTVGPLGVAQVQVTADADLGAGVVTLQGILDVQVVAGQAVSLGVSAGTPVPKA
jgi:hypothetical protein